MKIRITESQMKRLQENLPVLGDPIGELHRYIIKNEPVLVKLFNELSNLTLAQMLNNEFDFKNTVKILENIERNSRNLDIIASDYINDKAEFLEWKDIKKLDERLDNVQLDKFNEKLNVIDELNDRMYYLTEHFLEKEIMSKFQPLDITNL